MLGDKIFDGMKEMAGALIDRHMENMQLAYAKSDEGKLSVAMNFTVAPSRNPNNLETDASISYVVEKAKEKITRTVAENQLDLPLSGDKTYKMKK